VPTESTTLNALDVRSLALRWRTSPRSIQRKISAGLLPTIALPGSRRLLVPMQSVTEAERPVLRVRATKLTRPIPFT